MGNKSETSIGGKHSELNCSLGIAAGYTPTFRGFYRMMKALVSHLVILGRSLEKYALERWIIWRLWSWGEEPQSVRFCRGSRIEGRGARGRGSRVEGRGSSWKKLILKILVISNMEEYGGVNMNMEVNSWRWIFTELRRQLRTKNCFRYPRNINQWRTELKFIHLISHLWADKWSGWLAIRS